MAVHHVGQRLSVKHELCTVRYVGTVSGKPGQWLGVEWDDPGRGKHSGTFEGIEYFRCMFFKSNWITTDSELTLRQK